MVDTFLNKKYKLAQSENFEPLMVALGVGLNLRRGRYVRCGKSGILVAVKMSVFQGFCLLFLRTCVFFQLLSLSVILCFNLETRLPITKFGHNGSYFGFSVSSHQSLEEQEFERNRFQTTNKNYWLLIGAPLDKNIQPNTSKSGALWKCPLTTKINDCEQVVTDGKRKQSNNNVLPVYDPAIDDDELLAPLPDEIKEDQWLGVSVKSQEPMGKVIVCAHRYVRIERNRQSQIGGVDNSPRYARGLCYILAQNLTYDSQFTPCQGQGNQRTDFAFGYCQTGVSSMMLDDWAIMGSPGNDNWAGNLFVANVVDDLKERSSTLYHSPHAPQRVGLPEKYGLLGMSVSGGKYFKDDEMSYAAGAPRSNNTGQVYLFKKDMQSHASDPGVMNVTLVLNGEQIGSSFGYELATADVNGDKKPDLIVGAPFYFDQDIGGAVYIYYNTPPTGLNNQNKLRITGKPESRFGIALSNLGDLNKDGYEDIAVGAPYQGNGVVYIYLGSKTGLNPEPSQIISAESIPNPSPTSRPLVTWGSSLSPGVDMDDNGYPDLLVGAYESGIAVLLRARPIIQLETSLKPDFNLKNIDPSKTGCQADINAEHTCFTFEACCKILSLNPSQWKARSRRNGKLTLRYKLEAETFVPATKFSRVFFGPDKTARLHILEKEFEMKGGESCQTHTVYVKENTKDIQSPIRMKLSYSLVQSDPRIPGPGEPLPSMDDYPILDQTAADRTFEATFHTDCGDNEVCECELHVEADLQLEAKHGSGYYELLLGQHQEVTLNISTSNQGESAYEAQLFVSHHTHLSYIGQEKQRGAVCNPHNATLVVCSLGNPLKTGAWLNLKLRFDPTGLGEEPELKFLVWANSTSKEINKEDPVQLIVNIVRKAELSLTGFHRPEHIYYGGVLSTKPPLYLDEVGTRLVHTYQVFNAGPWRLSSLEIHVEWPYQVTGDEEGKEGKPLLYLESEPIVDGLGGGKCTVMGSINQYELHQKPDSLELDPFGNAKQHSSTRVKRESVRVKREISKYTVIPETYTDQEGKKHKIVKMNCTSGTARCFQIICSVYNLQANHEATIAIRARLWNATLVEDYPHVDRVYITSRAKIHIPPSLFLQQMNHTDDQTEVVTVAMKDLVTQSRTVWHIILIAILLGLFLLILLILCLRRLGFFHRRRRPPADDPTLSGNLRAADLDDDDEDLRAALKQHPF
uniref:Integrin alpha-PS1 n=1 Tax=Cacopsylla melanoneura TaxID=428564 RepID=A0A8D8TAD1_9HEMI